MRGQTTRYTPVSVEEFCNNKIRRLQETKQELIKNIPANRDGIEGYVTIKGESHILNKMKNMICEAKERLYLSVPEDVLKILLPELKDAIDRKVKTVLISNVPFTLEGATIYTFDKSRREIRLIVDSTNVLTGDIDDGEYLPACIPKEKPGGFIEGFSKE